MRLKPGKPMWFGRRGAKLVFGLPGNPLSTVACFLLFVGPALRRLQGEAGAAPRFVPARLAVPARPADGRTTLLTARLERGIDGVLEATPTEGQGSHLTGALAASDGFVAIPHGAGELARARAWTRCCSEADPAASSPTAGRDRRSASALTAATPSARPAPRRRG